MSTLAVNNITKADGGVYQFENKNLLINGGMNVWQRSVSATGLTSNGYHTVDRFGFDIASHGTYTIARSTDVPTGSGFTYSTKIDCTTADTSLAAGAQVDMYQAIEAQNLIRTKKGTASADSLTLSFWIKSNLTGTISAELYDPDNTRQITQTFTISSADTWEKKEITYAGDTTGAPGADNGVGMYVILWLAAGSNFTSGSLSTTWTHATSANRVSSSNINIASSTSNEILFTGLQLEQSAAATDFEFEPFETTQNKCFRYYRRLQKTDAGTTAGFLTTCNIGGSSFVEVAHPTMTMRTVPSISATGLVANDHSATSGDCDGVVLNSGRTNGVGVSYKLTFASGSMTAGKAGKVISNADAEFLDFSAEL